VSDPRSVEKLTVGTIHSVCLRILEEFGVESGHFTRSLRVLDEHRLGLFLFKHFEELGLDQFFDGPTKRSISSMASIYSTFQERGTDIDALKMALKSTREANDVIEAALATFPKYLELLRTHHALDFSSILARTYELLNHDQSVLENVQERFKYIIVDE